MMTSVSQDVFQNNARLNVCQGIMLEIDADYRFYKAEGLSNEAPVRRAWSDDSSGTQRVLPNNRTLICWRRFQNVFC